MKKLCTLILIASLIFPQFASAQLGAVPIENEFLPFLGSYDDSSFSDLLGTIGGIFGVKDQAKALGKIAEKTTAAMNSIKGAKCIVGKALDILNSAEKIDQWSFGGLKLLTGPIGESAMLKGKIEALDGAKNCVQLQIDEVKKYQVPNLMIGQQKQELLDDLTKQKNTIELRLDELNTQYRIAQRGFWKSIVIATLIKTTKAVSQRIVNGLASKYKINNVMQYADAVASQVYTTQLIRDRAGDNQEQLILRSILTNPGLRLAMNSAIYERAADALEYNGQVFSARTMSAEDPDFYLKLAKFGDPETSVPYLKTSFDNRANEMKAVGLASAQNEVLLGSGLKAPRTCQGNVAEQQAIDQRWLQVNDEYANRQKLLADLNESYNRLIFTGQINLMSAADVKKLNDDIAKAKADLENASRKLIALPKSYQNPVLEICKAIASPAEMVNKGIDKAFSAFSKGLSDYNDNNLPFFLTFISDIGSNIAQNLIFGGDIKTALITESGNIAQAINLGINAIDAAQSKKNLENGIKFDYNVSASGPGRYELSWETLDVKGSEGGYVTISGPGISDVQTNLTGGPTPNKLQLTGSQIVSAPNGGTYSLRVFNVRNVPLANTAGLIIPKPETTSASSASGPAPGSPFVGNTAAYQQCIADGNEQAYCQSVYGSIRGAFVKRPTESLRGSIIERVR